MSEEKGVLARLEEYSSAVDQDQMLALVRFAPWANDKNYPMTAEEFGLAIRRAVAMGVDPFNPREVQIWKDKHGVHFQLAYTLIIEWVKKYYGDHTEPDFRELTDEEKEGRGLQPNDHAVECSFVMFSDLARAADVAQVFGRDRALRMVTKTGIGVATAAEWGGSYFAPAGRDKQWRLNKRAQTDAYRQAFGEPGPLEIHALRRVRGDDQITAEDWGRALEVEQGPQAAELAQAEARVRAHLEHVETLPVEVQLARAAHNSKVLYGDHDEDDPFADKVQVAELPDEPPPEQEGAEVIAYIDRVLAEEEESAKPEPEPPPAKRKAGLAQVFTDKWTKAATAVATDHPGYMKGGQVNFYHLAGAALEEGYEEITDKNLAEVCQKLRDRARRKEEIQPALIPG